MELSAIVGKASIMLISSEAAVMDLRCWRVSNIWIMAWSVSGFVYEFIFYQGVNIIDKCMGLILPIFLLGIFFLFGMMGAGDIKLFCVLGIWMGAGDVLICMLFAFAFGAWISAVKIGIHKNGPERFAIMEKYFYGLKTAEKKEKYKVKKAGKARIHVALLAFAAVLMKLAEVY